MARKLVAVNGLSREEWLEYRKKSIGGSEAAAVLGLSQWATPYTVWADKTGRLPPKEDNEAMRQGRDLEDYVAQRFCEQTGKKVRRYPYMMLHDEYDFISANIDRDIVGEKALLECKTTTVLNLRKFKNGTYPVNYYCQCMQYLGVTGYERAYLAVLVLGSGFYVFTIERDEDEIKALFDAEKEFWNTYVVPDVQPPVDGSLVTDDAIAAVWNNRYDAESESADLFSLDTTFERLEKVKASLAELETEKRTLEQTIKVTLGERESGFCGDRYSVTWKPQSRKTFDVKAFQAANPNIDLMPYYKESSTRVLRLRIADEG